MGLRPCALSGGLEEARPGGVLGDQTPEPRGLTPRPPTSRPPRVVLAGRPPVDRPYGRGPSPHTHHIRSDNRSEPRDWDL